MTRGGHPGISPFDPKADIASRSATACLSSATIPTWWAWGLIQSVVLIKPETPCRSDGQIQTVAELFSVFFLSHQPG